MSDHLLKTIEIFEKKLADQLAVVRSSKQLINQLCIEAGLPSRYADATTNEKSGPNLIIKSDQFYGQPQASCIREILEMRRALEQGPATINEIYESLVEGGFLFDTKNDDNAKRGLRISITKNSALFHKLPNGKIGMLEWYPNAKNKPKKGAVVDNDTQEDAEADGEDESEEKNKELM